MYTFNKEFVNSMNAEELARYAGLGNIDLAHYEAALVRLCRESTATEAELRADLEREQEWNEQRELELETVLDEAKDELEKLDSYLQDATRLLKDVESMLDLDLEMAGNIDDLLKRIVNDESLGNWRFGV